MAGPSGAGHLSPRIVTGRLRIRENQRLETRPGRVFKDSQGPRRLPALKRYWYAVPGRSPVNFTVWIQLVFPSSAKRSFRRAPWAQSSPEGVPSAPSALYSTKGSFSSCSDCHTMVRDVALSSVMTWWMLKASCREKRKEASLRKHGRGDPR